MRLILAEKPSVARDLARVLGCERKEQGFFAGSRDLVTYAVGHLVRLAEPAEMNPDWGKPWRREALPMLPRTWPLIPEPRTEDQLQVILRLFRDKRVTEIVNATDAGREGEAIFRRIYALSESTKPVQRFWTSSLTDDAIEDAFEHLRPAAEYDALGAAAQARAQLDWLIGMNHSRAATLHHHQLCSVGRVQTPTLAMVVRRHHQIAGFIKTYFHEVHAELVSESGDFIARALNPTAAGPEDKPGANKHHFESRPQAEAILRDCPEGTPAQVTEVEIRTRRTPPPQLHNLGELQKEANRRFGLPADRTLAIAQQLYEAKLLTYPRSSSRHLADDMTGQLPAVLRALRLPGREAILKQALHRATKGPRLSKRFVDSSKLSDHHAIIPTAKPAPGSLSSDERKIYDLVATRFLGIFLPDKETEETRIDLVTTDHKHPFRARGTRLLAPGWTILTGNPVFNKDQDFDPANPDPPSEEPDRQLLPVVRQGEIIPILDAELVTRERKPPPRYTDATLLAAMETAGREIDDEALREAMRGRGLGTEATRAAILEKLIHLDYMLREGKQLEPTGKGLALIASLEAALPHLASPELTGDMEAKLRDVEAGTLDAAALIAEISTALKQDIPAAFKAPAMEAPAAAPITATGKDDLICPKCRAGRLTRRQGPNGDFYTCARQKEGCNFTINLQVAKKTLTDRDIQDLCSPRKKHSTRLIQGFTSKAGKKFDAHLQLTPAPDFRVDFVFPR